MTRKDMLAFVAAAKGPGIPSGFRSGAIRLGCTPAPAVEPGDRIVEVRGPVRSSGLHLSETPRIPIVEVEGQQIPGRGEYFIDVTPIRNTIASRMRQSVTEIPHGWMMIEVDVTNLVVLRSKLKDEFRKREGTNFTYLAFFIKAVVNAIKDFPIMNSVWAVDKIIVKRDINISLSVGTEDSVFTPVIKNADQKNIAGLAHEIESWRAKPARASCESDRYAGRHVHGQQYRLLRIGVDLADHQLPAGCHYNVRIHRQASGRYQRHAGGALDGQYLPFSRSSDFGRRYLRTIPPAGEGESGELQLGNPLVLIHRGGMEFPGQHDNQEVPHDDAASWQTSHCSLYRDHRLWRGVGAAKRIRGDIDKGERAETLLLLQHPPTYTLGTDRHPEHLLLAPKS